MGKLSNEQMQEVFFCYREIALQYLLSSNSFKFLKTDENYIVGMSDAPLMLMVDALFIRRLQLVIATEKEVNVFPNLVQKLNEILTKAKIALYETNQERIQKV